jgi:hypothetical protein
LYHYGLVILAANPNVAHATIIYPAIVNIICGTPYPCKSNTLSTPITETADNPTLTATACIFFQKIGVSPFHLSINVGTVNLFISFSDIRFYLSKFIKKNILRITQSIPLFDT